MRVAVRNTRMELVKMLVAGRVRSQQEDLPRVLRPIVSHGGHHSLGPSGAEVVENENNIACQGHKGNQSAVLCGRQRDAGITRPDTSFV